MGDVTLEGTLTRPGPRGVSPPGLVPPPGLVVVSRAVEAGQSDCS